MATGPETHRVEHPSSDGAQSLSDVASGTNGISDAPSTRQLDFYQAMTDFKLMFPCMDEDVIEAVLRANHGAVDDTIDQLLTMNVDSERNAKAEGRSDQTDARSESPIYMNHGLVKVPNARGPTSGSSSEVGSPPKYEARFDPPSYNDCLSSSVKPSPTHSSSSKSATALLAELGESGTPDSDLMLESVGGATGYTPKKDETSEKTLLKRSLAIDEDSAPTPMQMPPMMSLLNHDYTGKAHDPASAPPTRPKKRYRDWNPPMLGTLPDDFLRFTVSPLSTPERHVRPNSHQSTPEHIVHHTPQHQLHNPQMHHPRHHSPHHHQTHHPPNWMKLSPQRSMSHAHTVHGTRQKMAQVGRSQSLRNEPGTITVVSSRKNPNLRTVTATHGMEEISSNLIQRKMWENERARTCNTETMTPEQAQVLEDERLALLSQNGEFLQVLQQDADFMRTLERDRMNATAFETPSLDPISQSSTDQAEGYGMDSDVELGAFPFSQPLPKDENAEFRRQLSHMGGLSKKKFAAIAKKFFTRKKKQKKVTKDSLAPSTANLLDEDDTDEELREALHTEKSGFDQ